MHHYFKYVLNKLIERKQSLFELLEEIIKKSVSLLVLKVIYPTFVKDCAYLLV